MWRNAYETYLEERILSADPVELIGLLYQGALSAVADARRRLAAREILPRAQAISKACNILLELNTALDHQRGGEISTRLSQLYGYMHRRLVEANFRQTDAPLAEVESLLETLADGWAQVKERTSKPEPERRSPFVFAAEPELAHASASWSF